MLEHLRLRVTEILAQTRAATLATSGPAGLQARQFPCEAQNLLLYLLLPGTSDQLLNLEFEPDALISTAEWQLQGAGRILAVQNGPADLALAHLPEANGCVLVEIQPQRFQLYRQNGWGFSETIDL